MSFDQTLQDLITLTGFTPADVQLLSQTRDQLEPWHEAITATFYNTLYGYKATQAVFHDGERPAREGTLHNWYQMLLSGKIDETFWRWQWYVGLIHIPRGVTNPYMLGMMSRVQLLFAHQCQETFPPEQATAIFAAFKRITDVIAGLIAEGYFESYVQAMERMSGQSRVLIDRMVQLEVLDMLGEAKRQRA